MPTTRITTQQCVSHTAPTLTVLVKNTHLAKVWFGHNTDCQAHLCSINFWCGFVCQGVFFLTNAYAVLQSCRFYTGSIVPKA